jgi:hypothetical protein
VIIGYTNMPILQKYLLKLITREVIEWWLRKQAEDKSTKLTETNALDMAKVLKDCECK